MRAGLFSGAWNKWGPQLRQRRALAVAGLLLVISIAVATLSSRPQVAPAAAAEPMVVNVIEAPAATALQLSGSYLGRVEPAQESELGFEVSGKVSAVLVRDGQTFRKGQVLARLDTELLRSRRAELAAILARSEAEERLAQSALKRLTDVAQANPSAASEIELDNARFGFQSREASTRAAAAQVAHVDAQIGKSLLRAPFDGVVLQRRVDEGEVVAPSSPALVVASTAFPRLRVGIPSSIASSLAEATSVNVRIGDRDYSAVFERLVPARSKSTQTLDALFRLPVPIGPIASGDPAHVLLERSSKERGYWVPVTALTEAEGGLWSLFVAVEQGDETRLVRKNVELLHQQSDRAFVRGTLAAGDRIVVDGTHRLVPGMAVTTRVAAKGRAK